MNILAIDYGNRRIGLAMCSTELKTVVPLKILQKQDHKKDLENIQNIINEYDIAKILIGLPLNMDGTESKMTRAVRNFRNFLKRNTNLSIQLFDERLSSFEAEETLRDMYPDFKKRKAFLDSVSAMIILKTYLEETCGKESR